MQTPPNQSPRTEGSVLRQVALVVKFSSALSLSSFLFKCGHPIRVIKRFLRRVSLVHINTSPLHKNYKIGKQQKRDNNILFFPIPQNLSRDFLYRWFVQLKKQCVSCAMISRHLSVGAKKIIWRKAIGKSTTCCKCYLIQRQHMARFETNLRLSSTVKPTTSHSIDIPFGDSSEKGACITRVIKACTSHTSIFLSITFKDR